MKGLFIPEITAEMFKNGCLESIEALMAEGEIYDIDYEPERKKGWWNNHEVACIIADLMGDACACNHNGIDEWLPKFCDFANTDACPHPVGVACWEQFLKWKGEADETD